MERFHTIIILDFCRAPAYRTVLRWPDAPASGQVFRDLRDDHIGFVDLYCVAGSQCQLPHDAQVVHGSTANRRPLQLHRIEHSDRIDQSCS